MTMGTPRSPRSGWARVAGVLATPSLARFLAGRLCATHGAWIFRVAIGWTVWEMTRSPLMVAVAVALQLGPHVLLAPLAGVLADRSDKRRLLAATDGANGVLRLAIGGLALGGALSVELLLVLIAVTGCIGGLSQAAAKTMVGSLVADEDLATAISLNSVIFNVATFVGPAIAGLVIAQAGAGWAFLLAGVLALVFVVLVLRLDAAAAAVEAGAGHGVGRDLADGLRHAWNEPVLRWLLALHLASATLARPFMEFVPALVTTLFGGGAQQAAWVLSAVGLGSVTGGLWLAQRDPARGQLPVVLGAMLGLALVLIAFVWMPVYALALPLAFVAGFGMLARAAAIQTLIQSHSARGMRGRAVSLYAMLLDAGAILGSLVIGALAQQLGLRWALTLSVSMALVVWAVLRNPLRAAVQEHSHAR